MKQMLQGLLRDQFLQTIMSHVLCHWRGYLDASKKSTFPKDDQFKSAYFFHGK